MFCSVKTSVVELPLWNAASAGYFGHLAAALDLHYWIVPELNMSYAGSSKVAREGSEGSAGTDTFRRTIRTIVSENHETQQPQAHAQRKVEL